VTGSPLKDPQADDWELGTQPSQAEYMESFRSICEHLMPKVGVGLRPKVQMVLNDRKINDFKITTKAAANKEVIVEKEVSIDLGMQE